MQTPREIGVAARKECSGTINFNYFFCFAKFLIKSENTGAHLLPSTLAAATDTHVTLDFILHLGLSGIEQQGEMMLFLPLNIIASLGTAQEQCS